MDIVLGALTEFNHPHRDGHVRRNAIRERIEDLVEPCPVVLVPTSDGIFHFYADYSRLSDITFPGWKTA